MKTLFIAIGISGSGKSHYFKNDFFKNFQDILKKCKLSDILVSSDELRKIVTGNVNDFSKDSIIWNTIIPNKLKDSLNNYNSAVLDATNLDKNRYDLIKKLNIHELHKVALIFKPNLILSINRIKKDLDSLIDRSNVPTDIVIKQYNKFITNVIGYQQWDGEWNKKIENSIKNNLKFQFDEFYFI